MIIYIGCGFVFLMSFVHLGISSISHEFIYNMLCSIQCKVQNFFSKGLLR